MAVLDIANLILVRAGDGSMKYLDPLTEQFFTIEEVESAGKELKPEADKLKEKVAVEPVLTFEHKKVPVSPEISEKKEVLQPVAEKKEQKPKTSEPFAIETLEPDNEASLRRVRDQMAVDEKVNLAIDKLKISFSDEKIKNQFINLLKTYFRGVRTDKEVEYLMTLPKSSGGLELVPEKVKLILSVLAEYSSGVSKERKHVLSIPKEKMMPAEPVPSTELPSGAKEAIEPPKTAPPAPSVGQKVMIKPIVYRPRTVIPEPVRPRVADIEAPRKLVGPLEELALMNLKDFRRLGKDREQIINYIMEKLRVASGDSLPKKVLAIKEWKKSPVFRLYLEMNLQAMQERVPMQTIIENRQHRNEDALTLSELEAINYLNASLGKIL